MEITRKIEMWLKALDSRWSDEFTRPVRVFSSIEPLAGGGGIALEWKKAEVQTCVGNKI